MCGRFEQSETPRYYADALSVHISEHLMRLEKKRPSYNVAPGQRPWMMMLHKGEVLFIGTTWAIEQPKESFERKKPWICARVKKSLTERYFRHMFSEGRVIIPAS
jgi:putative SOS response-associated peptidase YedK